MVLCRLNLLFPDGLKKFYYDASKYDTSLEQFGIADPTVRTMPARVKKP